MQPFELSQLTIGPVGDILISAMIVVVVIMAVSAQIHSLTAIFVYDIYQTYISRFELSHGDKTGALADYSESEIADYSAYNRQSLIIRHAVAVFFSILTFPAALAFMAIPLDFTYKMAVVAIITGSSVLPVCLAILWYRTTGWGYCSGVWAGLVAGLGAWMLYAVTYPGSLSDFVGNTGRLEVLVTGLATSFVSGGLFCILVSLCTGGLSADRDEEEEWEKCRMRDNPVKPWAMQYAISAYRIRKIAYTGVPSYTQVRKKGKEEYLYSAFYILSISQIAQAWITQFYLQIHHACLSFVCVHQMAPPLTEVRDI